MPLPKIIFCENHYDPSTIGVMNKLLPELQKLGYGVFHAEISGSWSIKDHLESIEYEKTMSTQLSSKEMRALCSDKMQDVVDVGIKYAKQRSVYLSLYQSFLTTLEKMPIDYVGVDVPRVSVDLQDYVSVEGFKLRDKRMTKAYLKEERPTFGFIGALHAQGMQQQILEQDASTPFYFIHIHKERPTSQLEASLRAGEIDHPLGLHIYNANEISEDEIAETILLQISKIANQEQKENVSSQEKMSPYPYGFRHGLFSSQAENRWVDTFSNKENALAQKEKVSCYEKRPWQTKIDLIVAVKEAFGENSEYQYNFLSNFDSQGELYRQELMDFIAKPQHYDVIIDKLKILGRKAQRDLERNEYFSFFKPFYAEAKFQSLAIELIKTYERQPAIDLENVKNIDFLAPLKEESDLGFFNPGYNWKR